MFWGIFLEGVMWYFYHWFDAVMAMEFSLEVAGSYLEAFCVRRFCGLSSNLLSLICGQRCGLESLLPACCWCELCGQWSETCARAAYVTLSEVGVSLVTVAWLSFEFRYWCRGRLGGQPGSRRKCRCRSKRQGGVEWSKKTRLRLTMWIFFSV